MVSKGSSCRKCVLVPMCNRCAIHAQVMVASLRRCKAILIFFTPLSPKALGGVPNAAALRKVVRNFQQDRFPTSRRASASTPAQGTGHGENKTEGSVLES